MFAAVRSFWRNAGHWYETTPERALNRAYEAALAIKDIEEAHFNGQTIDLGDPRYGSSTRDHFRSDLKRHLSTIEVRLAEFNNSRAFLDRAARTIGIPGRPPAPLEPIDRDLNGSAPARPPAAGGSGPDTTSPDTSNRASTTSSAANSASLNGSQPTTALPSDPIEPRYSQPRDRPFIALKKLELIDDVLARYGRAATTIGALVAPASAVREAAPPARQSGSIAMNSALADGGQASGNGLAGVNQGSGLRPSSTTVVAGNRRDNGLVKPSMSDRVGVLPRSLLTTIDRVRRDLDDRSEEEVLKNYRTSKFRTIISLRFILLLILVPLLTQQVAKNFLVGPIVDHVYDPPVEDIFLNGDMKTETIEELERYENFLKFQSLTGRAPKLNSEEIERELKEKAAELAEESRARSADAIKNVIADFISLAGFALVIAYSTEEIAILKSFLDEVMYGLSDSAKAFVLILSTDIFVGYHSAHGWEVIVSGISRHLGLPENKDFMFLFIATFPVILDAVIKYWIFRYLNRISPSAVATYKDMNE